MSDEILTLTPEEIEKLPIRRRKGTNRKKYIPYDLAKIALRREGKHVTTATKYRKWVKEERVTYMPYWPNRIYDNFDWGDFLGVKHPPFEEMIVKRRLKKAKQRPMWEAVRWVQRYCKEKGITTYPQWLEHYDNDSTIPRDIPRDPRENNRDEFPGTAVWLGTTPEAVQESFSNVRGVITLVHPVKTPQNVLELVSWPEGVGELRNKWKKQSDYDSIIGCWEIENELIEETNRILSENGFSDGGNRWTFPNVSQVTWELNSILKMVRL